MSTKSVDPLSHQGRSTKPPEPQEVTHHASSVSLQSRDDLALKKMSYTRIVGLAWLNSWRTEVFHLSILRTIFSLRPFFFSILPVIFFQFSGSLALRSEQALTRLHHITASEQTSNYILAGGIVLSLLCISWFADMLVAPALAKLANARLDNRKLSGTKALLNSIGEINQTLVIRLFHGFGFILFLFFSGMVLLVSQQLAVSSREHLTYGLVAVGLVIIFLAFHEIVRWLSQGYVATTASLGGGIGLTFKNIGRKFFRKLGNSLSWLMGLSLYLGASMGLVWLEIYLLSRTTNFGLSVLYLAIITTSLYLLWTNWIAFSNNYWTTLALKRTPHTQIAHAVRNAQKTERFRIWPVVLVFTILAILVLGYFFIMITNVDIVILAFSKISSSLPKNLQVLVPRP